MRKKRTLLYLKFWDHYQTDTDDARPIICEVFGVLWKEDALSYYVLSWICDGELQNSNNEVFVILKSTVVEKRRLG